jgi:hypothetical protein
LLFGFVLEDHIHIPSTCCGLEVQNPPQVLKSVKGPGNTFDLSPNWERTLLSAGNFSWDIYRVPPKAPIYIP